LSQTSLTTCIPSKTSIRLIENFHFTCVRRAGILSPGLRTQSMTIAVPSEFPGEGPLHISLTRWTLGAKSGVQDLEAEKDRAHSRANGVPTMATQFLTAVSSCAIVAGPLPRVYQLI
jgi:hypothetical protein